ncbi:MAG: aldo/keto reductase [Firmicutes bacterium]|nr:aldo/keto reductase [Bacillota bacterium]
MIYKEFQGKQLSALGFGAMRLPVIDGKDGMIDEKATAEMVAYAMEKGINYYDTAWGYHEGTSEVVMGKILKEYPRESFYLASKFPGYDHSTWNRAEEVFEKQLEKCGVEYFDFYMFHNVCEMNIEGYLDPQYGIYDYLIKQKQNGRISHLGFSAHGNLDTMKRFLEAYGKDMEFCQIQLNYLDWDFQNAKEKIELLNAYHIPVWVMEPLRGGKLAKLHESAVTELKELRSEESAVGWAFRFLQSVPEVVITLSGMSNMEQLKDNIAIYEEDKPTTEKENEILFKIAKEVLSGVPCTSCRYCTKYCEQELDIPFLIDLYNEHKFTNGGFMAPFALQAIDKSKHPDACVACRSCEEVCPQEIKISEVLADFASML